MIIVNVQFSNINTGFRNKKNDFKNLFTLVIFFSVLSLRTSNSGTNHIKTTRATVDFF